jgi:hypothetical protein
MLGLGDAITREDIKEMLSTEFKVNIEKDGGDIAFITYEKGGAEALVSRRLLLSTYALVNNDFSNLVLPERGWLPNYILRHISEIRFSFF